MKKGFLLLFILCHVIGGYANDQLISILNIIPKPHYDEYDFKLNQRIDFPNYKFSFHDEKWITISNNKETVLYPSVDFKNGFISVFDDKYTKNDFISRQYDMAFFTMNNTSDIIVGLSIADKYKNHIYYDYVFYKFSKSISIDEEDKDYGFNKEYKFMGKRTFEFIDIKFDAILKNIPRRMQMDVGSINIFKFIKLKLPQYGTTIVFEFRKDDLIDSINKKYYDKKTSKLLMEYLPQINIPDFQFEWDESDGQFFTKY